MLTHEVHRELADDGREQLSTLCVSTVVAAASGGSQLTACLSRSGIRPNAGLFGGARKDEHGYMHTILGSAMTSVTGIRGG